MKLNLTAGAFRQRVFLAACLILATAPRPAMALFSDKEAGTSAGEFLKLGGDARGVAMGGAMGAAAVDAAALFWNPAGLSELDKHHVTLTHGALYQSVSYQFAAYARPVRPVIAPRRRRFLRPSGLGTLAIGAMYLNAGSIKEINNTGTPTGDSFTPSDLAAMAGWGGSVTNHLDLGIALKFVQSQIQSSARTGSVDAGLRIRTRLVEYPWILALSGRNLSGKLQFHRQSDPLPMSLHASQSLLLAERWTLAAEMVFPRDKDPYAAYGTELRLPIDGDERAEAALRAGYNGRVTSSDLDGTAGISFGIGLRIGPLLTDYAWVPFGLLGHTHRFSFALKF